jgi:hypothetical protein
VLHVEEFRAAGVLLTMTLLVDRDIAAGIVGANDTVKIEISVDVFPADSRL